MAAATRQTLLEMAEATAGTHNKQAGEQLDQTIHALASTFTMGLSPIAISLAMIDWALHLASSPGRQMELAVAALQDMQEFVKNLPPETTSEQQMAILQSTRELVLTWWQKACEVRGVSPHHQHMNRFFLRQWFDMYSPQNWPWGNPEIWETAWRTGGRSLWQGEQNWLEDLRKAGVPEKPAQFRPGIEVAITPGEVVYKNHLMELIRYTPQTAQVYPEPVLIIPSWIMKYYILDLSPQNSMVRYLVSQGHQVYILSWNNPDAADRNLGMEDYLHLGVFAALQAIARISGKQKVHSAGYCLGGTLLAIAAAALARPGKVRDSAGMPELASVTLLAAQTDFTEPGEMEVLIDDSQVQMIEDLMAQTGYMTGAQMAGSFQFLNSRDLIWNKKLREYWLGVRDAGTDMMAWNADVTRLPERMHGEYLHQFFLENALAQGKYKVEQKPVALQDIRQPMFVVGTVRDQVSPWRSVYKILRMVRTEVSFLLASGGHNAGIVSEPGHPKRSYQVHLHQPQDAAIGDAEWAQQMEVVPGSWWPAWQTWLRERSGALQAAPKLPADMHLQAAPGSYVMKKFT